MISSEPQNILLPIFLWWCSIMSQCHAGKKLLLFSRSRSQQGLIWSKYDSFYYICFTADPFSSKLGFMVYYHKPECLMEKWDCCVQGQGHSKFQNVNECLPRWYPLNWWTFYYQTGYGDASLWARVVCKKIGLQSSRFRVIVESHIIKYDVSTRSADLLIFFQTCLIGWYIIISWGVLCKN